MKLSEAVQPTEPRPNDNLTYPTERLTDSIVFLFVETPTVPNRGTPRSGTVDSQTAAMSSKAIQLS